MSGKVLNVVGLLATVTLVLSPSTKLGRRALRSLPRGEVEEMDDLAHPRQVGSKTPKLLNDHLIALRGSRVSRRPRSSLEEVEKPPRPRQPILSGKARAKCERPGVTNLNVLLARSIRQTLLGQPDANDRF